MICNDCIQKTYDRCDDTIDVGTIADLNAPVIVYVKDIATEQIIKYSVTSSPTGLVELSAIPSQAFSENHTYEVWVTLDNTEPDERINILIGSDVKKCLEWNFIKTIDSTTI